MIKRLLCPQLPKLNKATFLSEDEAHHASRVLRLRDGDQIEAIDGKGGAVIASLRLREGPPRLEFLNEPRASKNVNAVLPITLEMAVLKGDAMEWVIEKAVELGVKRLVPILTDYTVVQIKNKGPETFQSRWQKIADQALKQCGRLNRLEVELPVSLETLGKETHSDPNLVRLWCDEMATAECDLMDWLDQTIPLPQDLRLLIGPEGGWSPAERQSLSTDPIFASKNQRISLSPLVLRAETAALFGISLLTACARLRNAKEHVKT